MQLRNAVLVDGVRSPFGRGGRGKLVATRLDVIGAQILRALLVANTESIGSALHTWRYRYKLISVKILFNRNGNFFYIRR